MTWLQVIALSVVSYKALRRSGLAAFLLVLPFLT